METLSFASCFSPGRRFLFARSRAQPSTPSALPIRSGYLSHRCCFCASDCCDQYFARSSGVIFLNFFCSASERSCVCVEVDFAVLPGVPTVCRRAFNVVSAVLAKSTACRTNRLTEASMLCRVYWLIEFPGEVHVALPAAEIVQCVEDACCSATFTAFSTWETSPIATLTASWISRRSSASVVSSL